MAASQQPSDRIMPPDTVEPVNVNLDVEEKPTDQDNSKEQPLPAKDERIVPPNPSQDVTSTGPLRDAMGQSVSFSVGGDHSAMYPPNIYAPQPQPIYYGGEWDEYPQYVNPEGLEIGSSGIYNDNPSLVFHTGYGYNSQMPYGPYSPVTTPLPSVRGDGQLYSAQQYPFSAPPYYQQQVPLSMPYITPEAPVSQTETIMALNSDQQGDAMLFGPRPGYPSPFGSFGRGNFGGSGSHIFHDSQGFVSGPPWSDWSKPSDGRSSTPLSSPAASPQPVGMPGSFGHNIGMISQQQRPSYGFGSGSSSYARGFPRSGAYQGSTLGNKSFPRSEANVWSSTATDKGRLQGRGNGYFCSSSGTPDVLSEQTRGPRAFKQKTQTTTGHDSSVDDKKNSSTSTAESCSGSFNSPYFTTEYNDGMFFIIKSYSEDNVHRSIKYGVWASTPNGNRKLDAAYHEAQEREGNCPVFLFFSVNASAQFCGVAEMVGPVDFDKSVDYWQQDKWSGQFPVKWHIIKDVPNSQFRHIILENNDNKPVTNSRDTQEVKLEQGVEMLKILKNYERDTSILDDFDFYEEREKAMQGRKAKQQATLIGGDENRDSAALPSNYVKHLSKTFAQAVRLEGSSSNSKENIGLEKAGSSPDSSDDSKVESVKSS